MNDDSSKDTFTCSHPSHEGEPVQHQLGTVEGNLHFLLGYGNPLFHLAPEHWAVIDPNGDPDGELRNPTNLKFWKAAKITAPEEGDLENGKPHSGAKNLLKVSARDEEAKKTGKSFNIDGQAYTAVPAQRVLYDNKTGLPVAWDVFRKSYAASTTEGLAEFMGPSMVKSTVSTIPSFDEEAYPLVKSKFPSPGSVVPFEGNTGETLYAAITPTHVKFLNRQHVSVVLNSLGRDFSEVSLLKGQSPELLFTVAKNILEIDVSTEQDLVKSLHSPDDADGLESL